MVLESVLLSLKRLSYRNDDDNIDRAHYFLTSNVLIALAILVSWKQFGGKPIECMTPPKFPGAWEDYAENYCWSEDTYMIPFDKRLESVLPDSPGSLEKRKDLISSEKISYYQWVPFFLIFQAFCFRAPSLFYKNLAAKTGLVVHDLVDIAINSRNIEASVRQDSVKSLRTYLQGALRFHRRLIPHNRVTNEHFHHLHVTFNSSFVSCVYMITKLLYMANAFLQFILLNSFLETGKNSYYGYNAVRSVLKGEAWETSKVFPRVTICDFEVRGDPANIQRYSTQCVLVINIFNEKIFVLLWFWYLVLILVTLLNVLQWLWYMLLPCSPRWFIGKHLELSEEPFDPVGSSADLDRFIGVYLHKDGMFVLRMITEHAGIVFGTELVLALWRSFIGIETERKASKKDENKANDDKNPHWQDRITAENVANYLRHRKRKDQRNLLGAATALGAIKSAGSSSDSEDDHRNNDNHRKRLIQDVTQSPSSAVTLMLSNDDKTVTRGDDVNERQAKELLRDIERKQDEDARVERERVDNSFERQQRGSIV